MGAIGIWRGAVGTRGLCNKVEVPNRNYEGRDGCIGGEGGRGGGEGEKDRSWGVLAVVLEPRVEGKSEA